MHAASYQIARRDLAPRAAHLPFTRRMHFVPASESLPAAVPAPRDWRLPLYVSAAFAALASTQPWIRVRFEGLFGQYFGPPAWQSGAGFTCLMTAALVAVMTLAETPARTTQQAVRPASLLLVGVAAFAFASEAFAGPGTLRGVTATWTWAFWFAVLGVPALLVVCTARCLPRRAPGYSSSGPPT